MSKQSFNPSNIQPPSLYGPKGEHREQSPAPTDNTLDEQLSEILATLLTNSFTSSDRRGPVIFAANAQTAIKDLFNATVTASKPEKEDTDNIDDIKDWKYYDNYVSHAGDFVTGHNIGIDTFETALRAAIGGNSKEG